LTTQLNDCIDKLSKSTQKKQASRQRRKKHIRKIVHGTPERPRLVIYRSLLHIYAQLIDDVTGKTLLGVSSLTPDLKDQISGKKPCEIAKLIGSTCAEKAKAKNIETVVFDRNGFPYHGRVKAVADGARAGGLKF
jgi:large subunit ribosomal protein L18